MALVFIFTKDVQKIIDAGSNVIEIPKGARISAAALDLIQDRQIQIRYGGTQGETPVEVPQPDRTPDEERPAQEISASPTSFELSDEELENIVNRVIQRFRQTRREAPPEPAPEETQALPDDDLVICRCEETTRGEIREAIKNGMRTLNGIKRITRAGMGLCQGQTCQRLVTQILASELGVDQSEIKPTTARAPVRPIPLSVFATG